MAKNKTTETAVSVKAFLKSVVDDEQKMADSLHLIELFSKWSGYEAKMWGPSIIGFGSYHYKYESGHEGDAPILAFSPRKAAISLYIYSSGNDNQKLLESLGKFKMAKACIYVKKVADIHLPTLEKLCKETMRYIAKKYPST